MELIYFTKERTETFFIDIKLNCFYKFTVDLMSSLCKLQLLQFNRVQLMIRDAIWKGHCKKFCCIYCITSTIFPIAGNRNSKCSNTQCRCCPTYRFGKINTFLACETEQDCCYTDNKRGKVTRYHIPRTNELFIKLNIMLLYKLHTQLLREIA